MKLRPTIQDYSEPDLSQLPDFPGPAPSAILDHETLVCMECGAEVVAGAVRQHFEEVHTIDGVPDWEQGWACRPQDVPTVPPWRGIGADRREVAVRGVRTGGDRT